MTIRSAIAPNPKAPQHTPLTLVHPTPVHPTPVHPTPVHPTPAAPAIRVEGLSIAYHGRTVLRDVSFDLTEGRVTALIGPSGCGKSSFLACLNRLTDLYPGCRVTGRVELGGEDVLRSSVDVVALRRRVGMIFQKPNPFPLSILRNLELPLLEHGVRDRRERRQRAENALEEVGLLDEVYDRLDGPALSLSGGQQQRLCIARALALEPEVILFDEPTSALDPLASAVVEERIAALRGRYTVVLVTHNLAQARRLADDVACLWYQDGAGWLVEHGSATDVFERPRNELTEAYVRGVRG